MENILRHEHGREQSADGSAKLTADATSLQQKFVILGIRCLSWVRKSQKAQSVSMAIIKKTKVVVSIALNQNLPPSWSHGECIRRPLWHRTHC